MHKDKLKKIGKIIVKSLFVVLVLGAVSMPFLKGGLKDPMNPLSHKEITPFDSYVTEAFTYESTTVEESFTLDELLLNIPEFVKTPEGGVPWTLFGATGQNPYTYTDEEGGEWSGVRPEFSEELKALDGTEILIQAYMFPLGQEEQQSMFLLGPFPISCPFHYHVTPNLIIEAHADPAIEFSYDAIDVKGTLELVYKDDEYNVFYRLKNVEIVN